MKTMSLTAKWISGIIALCIFFGSIILGMATIPTSDMRDDIENHEVRIDTHNEQIGTLYLQQAVVETKLDNIQEDVKEIKEIVQDLNK